MFLTTICERRSLENPSTPLSAPDDFLYDVLGSYKASSGVRVNRETALTYSPWWRGINLISRDVAKLPTYLQKRNGNGRQMAPEHPAYNLLRHKPNEYLTAFQWKQAMQSHALEGGNGYSLIERDGAARPIGLILMDPQQVIPVRANGVVWYVYEFKTGQERKIPATDVIHIKGFGYDGLMGYAAVAKAREVLGRGMAMQTYSSVFFRNNARPNIVLQTPVRLKPEAVRNLRESWERLHSGLENAHRTAILEEGMQAKELSINARDAQLTEQEKFSLIDVANFLNIPVHKIGGDGRTSYNSLEQENQGYLDDGLDPWLVSWEEECRDKLLTEEEKAADSHLIHFDRKQLLRANLAARGTYYVQALQWGWETPDGVREEEGANPLPDDKGQIVYRPLNMQVMPLTDKAKQSIAENPAPKAAGGDKPSTEEPPPDAGKQRTAFVAAARSVLKDAVRRTARRIGTHAERAANTPANFCGWLDALEKEYWKTAGESLEVAERCCATLGADGQVGLGAWMLDRIKVEFSDLADRVTAKELSGEAAKLAAELGERLAGEAVEIFLGD